MEQYIPKSAVVAEIERRIADNKKDIERTSHKNLEDYFEGYEDALSLLKQQYLDTLDVKEVDLIIHTIIAECCDWLAINTNLSHDKIESCRNLMLTIKKEQFKEQKGEESVNEGLKETQKNIWRSLDEKPSFPISNNELLCSILVLYNNGNMFLYRYGKNGIPNDSLTPHFCDIMNAKWCYCKDVINK